MLNTAVFDYCLPTIEGVEPKPTLTAEDGWAAMPPQDGSSDPRQGHAATGVEVELDGWTGPACMARGQMPAGAGAAARLRTRLSASGWEQYEALQFPNVVSTFHRIRKGDPQKNLAVEVREVLSPNRGFTLVRISETPNYGPPVTVRH